LLLDLHTDFSGGRSCGLVFPSLEEFSIACCDPYKGFGIVNKAEVDVFPVVMYGCKSCTIKKAECQRIDEGQRRRRQNVSLCHLKHFILKFTFLSGLIILCSVQGQI